MTSREQISSDYLFFRFPVEYILTILPPVIGIFVSVFTNQYIILEMFSHENITNQLTTDINTYLKTVKISSFVLITFFCSYRWTIMKGDGSFAFWISFGINKRKFFLKTVIKFIFLLFLGQLLGLLLIVYINYYFLDYFSSILLLLGMLSHLTLIVSIAILLSTIVTHPEISALSYLIIMGLIYITVIDSDTIVNQLFHSDLQYNTENGIFAFLMAAMLSLIIYVITFRTFKSMDIET